MTPWRQTACLFHLSAVLLGFPWQCAAAAAETVISPAETMLAAARRGDDQTIAALIRSGADPNTRDDKGRTVVMLMILNGHGDHRAQHLLRYGVDVNAQDHDGRTGLMYAVLGEEKARGTNAAGSTWRCLAFRPNLLLTDRFRKTALDYALELGAENVVEAVGQGYKDRYLGQPDGARAAMGDPAPLVAALARRTRLPALCAIGRTPLRQSPEREGAVLALLAIGERVHWLGDARRDPRQNGRVYLRIERAGGVAGWAPLYALIIHPDIGVIQWPTALSSQPHLASGTAVSLAPLDFVAITARRDRWFRVVGEGERKSGWISRDTLSTEPRELVAAMCTRRRSPDGARTDETVAQTPYPDAYVLRSRVRPRMTVRNVRELFDALGPHREIVLEPGDYMLDEAPEVHAIAREGLDRRLQWQELDGLTVTGLEGDRPVRLLWQGNGTCGLTLSRARHLRLDNLTLARIPGGSRCRQEVLQIADSSHVVLNKVVLEGPHGLLRVSASSDVGVAETVLRGSQQRWALLLEKTRGFEFTRSAITSCRGEVMVVRASSEVVFDHSRFHSNHQRAGWMALFRLIDSPDVTYAHSDIEDNRTITDEGHTRGLFAADGDTQVRLRRCRIRRNAAGHFFSGGQAALVDEGTVFAANDFPGGWQRQQQPRPQDAARQRLEVSSVDQLVSAIGSNREIHLAPGDYHLDDLVAVAGDQVTLDGGLRIRGVHDLQLVGTPAEGSVRILTSDTEADVMQLSHSSHVLLRGVQLSHFDVGSACGGGVLRIDQASDVVVADSVLHGSGAFGVLLSDVKRFDLVASHIIDCSNQIMGLTRAEDVTFSDSYFVDNKGWSALLTITDSRRVSYRNCALVNNHRQDAARPLAVFSLSDSDVSLRTCRVSGNSAAFFLRTEKGATLVEEEGAFEANTFTHLLSPDSEPASYQTRDPSPVPGEASPTRPAAPPPRSASPAPSGVSVPTTRPDAGRSSLTGVVDTQHTGLSVRRGPGLDHPIVAAASGGQRVIVMERVGDWYRVRLENGLSGFAHRGFVDIEGAAPQLVPRPGSVQRVRELAVGLDGGFFIRREPDVLRLDMQSGEWLAPPSSYSPFPSGMIALAPPEEGLLVGLDSFREAPVVVDGRTGEERPRFGTDPTGERRIYRSAALSKDGHLFAASSVAAGAEIPPKHEIEVWDARPAAHGEPISRLRGHAAEVVAIDFSPDGRQLATAGWDYTVRLWDLPAGTVRHVLEGHAWFVNSVVFSPDGARLASASDDGTVRLWDARTGHLEHTLAGHEAGVTTVAFSPDGQVVASGSWDGSVRLWDAVSGSRRSTLGRHDDAVTSIVFGPDGHFLMSGSWDGRIEAWDWRRGQLAATLTVLSDPSSGEMPEWLVTAADGRVDFSGGALRFLIYNDGGSAVTFEEYQRQSRVPGLLGRFFTLREAQ